MTVTKVGNITDDRQHAANERRKSSKFFRVGRLESCWLDFRTDFQTSPRVFIDICGGTRTAVLEDRPPDGKLVTCYTVQCNKPTPIVGHVFSGIGKFKSVAVL